MPSERHAGRPDSVLTATGCCRCSSDGTGSRLSPFKKVPRIGLSAEPEKMPRPPPKSEPSRVNPRAKMLLAHASTRPSRPVQLAIRLLNGERIVGHFATSTRIAELVRFVEERTEVRFASLFYLATADIPKREFHQLHLSLDEAQIHDKTLLLVDRF